jgi:hypothetical protein
MKELLGAKLPLFGQWYDVIMVDNNGVVTLSPSGPTAKTEKKAARAFSAMNKIAKSLTLKS